MAKKNTNTQTAPAEATSTDTNEVVLAYGDHSVKLAELSPAALAYLAQYGFAKSLQDSVAGVKKEVTEAHGAFHHPDATDETRKPWTALAEDNSLGTDTELEAMIKAEITRLHANRFAAIVAGTVGSGSPRGPRLSGPEALARKIAGEEIRAKLAEINTTKPAGQKIKAPTGDAWAAMVDKYTEAHGERLRAEAERRLATTKAGVTDAGADVAAMLGL